MITYYVYRNGQVDIVDKLDPAWLSASSPVMLWADIRQPGPDEAKILRDVFGFHPLSIEDALQASSHPKVEWYGTYLYVILHGIDFKQEEHAFETLDVDLCLGRN